MVKLITVGDAPLVESTSTCEPDGWSNGHAAAPIDRVVGSEQREDLMRTRVAATLVFLLVWAVAFGQVDQGEADDKDRGFAYRVLGTVAIDFQNGLLTLSLWSTKRADRAMGHMVLSDVVLHDKDAPGLRFTQTVHFTLFTDVETVQGSGAFWVSSIQKAAEVVQELFPGSGTSVAAVHARLEGTDEKGRTVEGQLDGLLELRIGEPVLAEQIDRATVGARFLPPPGSNVEATLTVQHARHRADERELLFR